MRLDGLNLDPLTILGLTRGASAEQIHDAYRDKSKKYHPDHGGDEWVFRIVARAYQVLTERNSDGGPDAIQVPSRDGVPDTGRVRAGIFDRSLDPIRIVAVETLWVRYEVEDLLTLIAVPHPDRDVSGSLHLSWPDPTLVARLPVGKEAPKLLKTIQAAFDEARKKTRPRDARIESGEGNFEGWLSYPSGPIASTAFKTLHAGLISRGLGARQWTRDLVMPRET